MKRRPYRLSWLSTASGANYSRPIWSPLSPVQAFSNGTYQELCSLQRSESSSTNQRCRTIAVDLFANDVAVWVPDAQLRSVDWEPGTAAHSAFAACAAVPFAQFV